LPASQSGAGIVQTAGFPSSQSRGKPSGSHVNGFAQVQQPPCRAAIVPAGHEGSASVQCAGPPSSQLARGRPSGSHVSSSAQVQQPPWSAAMDPLGHDGSANVQCAGLPSSHPPAPSAFPLELELPTPPSDGAVAQPTAKIAAGITINRFMKRNIGNSP
jgi:hypothetical protein